jgi:hypothetical protein
MFCSSLNEDELFETAKPPMLRMMKEFAALIRDTFDDNKEYTGLARGISSGVVMLNPVRAQQINSAVDGQLQIEAMEDDLKKLRLETGMALREFVRQFEDLVRIFNGLSDEDMTDKKKSSRMVKCVRMSRDELDKVHERGFSTVVQTLGINAGVNTYGKVKSQIARANDTQTFEFAREKRSSRGGNSEDAPSPRPRCTCTWWRPRYAQKTLVRPLRSELRL